MFFFVRFREQKERERLQKLEQERERKQKEEEERRRKEEMKRKKAEQERVEKDKADKAAKLKVNNLFRFQLEASCVNWIRHVTKLVSKKI